MDPLATHRARIGHLREAFAEANERFVARPRGVDDESARRIPEAGGCRPRDRVARREGDDAVCGLMSGDLPERSHSRPTSGAPVARDRAHHPPIVCRRRQFPAPPGVTRMGLSPRSSSAEDGARARRCDPERGAGRCISSASSAARSTSIKWGVGDRPCDRHNKQAKQVLGR